MASEASVAVMRQAFVVFESPGTFFPETTTRPIATFGDVAEAVRMSRTIVERYDARPYGFRFILHARAARELDSRQVKSSGMYYLGGKVETAEEIEARNDPEERILRSNMRCNGWDKVLRTAGRWTCTRPLEAEDVVLDMAEFPAGETEGAEASA